MTEEEWLTGTSEASMLDFLKGRTSDRKLRLFAAACCRHIWSHLVDVRSQKALERAEQYADTPDDLREFVSVRNAADQVIQARLVDEAATAASCTLADHAWLAAALVTEYVRLVVVKSTHAWEPDDNGENWPDRRKRGFEAGCEEARQQRELLRHIVGNPFRPQPPRPAEIAPLAEQVYQGRWDLVPLLGEWLQENGHWHEGEHCLDPNIRHVKGCWVVDWVTGRQ